MSVKGHIAGYATRADTALGARRTLARFSSVLGASSANDSPSHALVLSKPQSFSTFVQGISVSQDRDVPDGLQTIAGAVAGGYLWRSKHPFLGIIAGASLGRNLPALVSETSRGPAFRNLATTAGGVAGSLFIPKYPVVGFIVGALAGGTAAYYGGLK